MKWMTFDRRVVDLKTIPHQHLSNIIWFGTIFHPQGACREAYDELYDRFGGKILPYQPHPSFKAERDMLERLEMIIPHGSGLSIIYYKSQAIGYIWNEIPNFTNIIGAPSKKLVRFTRLDVPLIGDQVVFMPDKKLDSEFDHFCTVDRIIKGQSYTVFDEGKMRGGFVVKLEGYRYWYPIEEFAMWEYPKPTRPEKVVFSLVSSRKEDEDDERRFDDDFNSMFSSTHSRHH